MTGVKVPALASDAVDGGSRVTAGEFTDADSAITGDAKGDGCEIHVELGIWLLLFSLPQRVLFSSGARVFCFKGDDEAVSNI
mgnify:CR=1 FL=1